MAPICFVDCETDGVHPNRKPWEIALIRREPDGDETEVSFFVSIDLSTADLFGLKVGRFYERHPVGRVLSRLDKPDPVASWGDPSFKNRADAAQLVARMTHGAQLVGAVPSFDAEVFDHLLRDNGLCPAWHHRLRCVETLTAGHFGEEVGGLGACARALDIEVTDEHTALGDARTARAIWDAILVKQLVSADAVTSS